MRRILNLQSCERAGRVLENEATSSQLECGAIIMSLLRLPFQTSACRGTQDLRPRQLAEMMSSLLYACIKI